MGMTIDEEKKSKLRSIRKWLIIQKYTLQRGYGYLNVAMLGVVFAASIKTVLPGLIDTFWKFVILTILSFIGLYFLGWLDYKYKFLHDEMTYTTETNPLMMKVVDNVNKIDKTKKEDNGNTNKENNT